MIAYVLAQLARARFGREHRAIPAAVFGGLIFLFLDEFLMEVAIAAGFAHTCAFVDLGGATPALRCWGRNGEGQLGNGTQTSSNAPVAVSGF